MTASTDFLTPLAEGFAELLAAANIGVTWQADGAYTPAAACPVFIAAVPLQPAGCLTITPTPLSDAPVFTDTTVGVQFRYRSPTPDIRSLWPVRDAVRAYLKGRFPVRLPTGLHVWSLTAVTGASMGQNDQRLWEWADNATARVGALHPA